jgi:Ca2+:H+ antiporter
VPLQASGFRDSAFFRFSEIGIRIWDNFKLSLLPLYRTSHVEELLRAHILQAMNGRLLIKPTLDWLLVFMPVTILLKFWPGFHNDTAIFICAGLTIVPLAGWLGRATEELAERLGHGVGALLNATLGNAAELIIALMALSKGLTGVVKASITGSIIGNILLVLGISILMGGLKYPEQRFNQTAARSSACSLTLAAIGLLIPTVFHFAAAQAPGAWSPALEQKLSLVIAVVLLATYALSLVFSLKTHKQLFVGGALAPATQSPDNHRPWSVTKTFFVLVVTTALIALFSEFLVSTVEGAQAALGLTEVFIGVIIVAVIGNAAEHSSAILMALKNKMDLSLGIAIGSSLQIALFVAPVLLFVSYFWGQPMDLEFTVPEVVAVLVAVHIADQISGDGESNWLEGVQLLAAYLILAVLFYYLPGNGPAK